MATLFRQSGGAVTVITPSTWTNPSNLFTTQDRNDGSAYSFSALTSTVTLPSSNLADGYLIVAAFEYEDTSNGRHMPQARIQQHSGTGNFIYATTGGFNRDTSEDRAYVRTWAFVDNPSASSEFRFYWQRDTDAPTGGTVRSVFEVIPFYYTDIGLYSSTSAAVYGGTTPNQVTGFTGTDGTNITISSNTVTVAGDNRRYLCLGSYYLEGVGANRSQRWGGFRLDGTKSDDAKAYTYYRNTSNDESGEMFTTLIETDTIDRTVDMFLYRGDGVGAGQGGADNDGGSTPTVGDHAMVILELNTGVECFHSIDNTGGVDLNVTTPVDHALCRTAAITFNDSASFTRNDDNSMQVEQTGDYLFGANISAAQEVVSTTSRWTSQAEFTVNGVEDTDTFGGDYGRNNQGTIDTFGWSANLMSYVALTSGDDVGVSTTELAGGEDGGQFEVQPNWSGFWGINLDTLENVAPPPSTRNRCIIIS